MLYAHLVSRTYAPLVHANGGHTNPPSSLLFSFLFYAKSSPNFFFIFLTHTHTHTHTHIGDVQRCDRTMSGGGG